MNETQNTLLHLLTICLNYDLMPVKDQSLFKLVTNYHQQEQMEKYKVEIEIKWMLLKYTLTLNVRGPS